MTQCDICGEHFRGRPDVGRCPSCIALNNNRVPCDEINRTSWDALPRSLRAKDFCQHCEFKCEHGRGLIAWAYKKALGMIQ